MTFLNQKASFEAYEKIKGMVETHNV